jgi:hypothetical protein
MYPYVAPDITKIHTFITLGIRHRAKPLVFKVRKGLPRGLIPIARSTSNFRVGPGKSLHTRLHALQNVVPGWPKVCRPIEESFAGGMIEPIGQARDKKHLNRIGTASNAIARSF